MSRITLVIGMLTASLGLGWLLFLGPALSDLHAVEAKQTQLHDRISAASQLSNQLERIRGDYASQQRAYQRVATRLPNSAKIARLLQVITANTQHQGLRLRALTPGPISVESFYKSQSIALTVQGYWPELGAFIERISHLARLVSLERLQWQPVQGDTAGDQQQIQLTLRAYWHHHPDDAPVAPKRVNRALIPPHSNTHSNALSAQANPFVAGVDTTTPGLGKGMVYQGRIRVDGEIWALLRRPTGEVIRLQSGERLPSGTGQIGRIDPKRITIEPTPGD